MYDNVRESQHEVEVRTALAVLENYLVYPPFCSHVNE